jgi:hypothetical protein
MSHAVINLLIFFERIKGGARTGGIALMKDFKLAGGAEPRLTSGGEAVTKGTCFIDGAI